MNDHKNQKLRMDAYYYGFELTGAPEIDLILSAVACAGKSSHHTDQWNEQSEPWPAHTGNSPAEWIQNAAIIAAEGNKQASAEIARLQAENEALLKDVDKFYELYVFAKKELHLLRKNSERYEWLRNRPTCAMHEQGWQIRHHWLDQNDSGRRHGIMSICLSGESLDGVIDNAMSKEGQS